MERKELGRIKSATFGFGGYDNAMFGLSLAFGSDDWGVNDFKGTWPLAPTGNAQWSVEDQRGHFADTVAHLHETLKAAKKKHLAELVGVPVEVTFDGNALKSWRVLTEVL